MVPRTPSRIKVGRRHTPIQSLRLQLPLLVPQEARGVSGVPHIISKKDTLAWNNFGICPTDASIVNRENRHEECEKICLSLSSPNIVQVRSLHQ